MILTPIKIKKNKNIKKELKSIKSNNRLNNHFINLKNKYYYQFFYLLYIFIVFFYLFCKSNSNSINFSSKSLTKSISISSFYTFESSQFCISHYRFHIIFL